MKAETLREALDAIKGSPFFNLRRGTKGRLIADAARERLAQLEGDPELVERIAEAIHNESCGCIVGPDQYQFDEARAVLNALTTSTDEGEG